MHVLNLRCVLARVEVRRLIRVLFELRIRDWNSQFVSKALEVVESQLLHLVSGVSTLERLAEREALDGLRKDDGRLALVLNSRLVGGVKLAVVVTSALESPDLII